MGIRLGLVKQNYVSLDKCATSDFFFRSLWREHAQEKEDHTAIRSRWCDAGVLAHAKS